MRHAAPDDKPLAPCAMASLTSPVQARRTVSENYGRAAHVSHQQRGNRGLIKQAIRAGGSTHAHYVNPMIVALTLSVEVLQPGGGCAFFCGIDKPAAALLLQSQLKRDEKHNPDRMPPSFLWPTCGETERHLIKRTCLGAVDRTRPLPHFSNVASSRRLARYPIIRCCGRFKMLERRGIKSP
jgi:hypothetical protein